MAFINTSSQIKSYLRAICSLIIFCGPVISTSAQIVVTADKTAAILANALVGTGVTILSPTLTCPGNANGIFTTGIFDPIGIANGIVLTNGDAKDTTIGGLSYYGVAGPFDVTDVTMPDRDNGTAGDPLLTALAGQPTFDACILEFDFKAAGDTIKFNYVFGSSEYQDFTCTSFNDVFGFFISGGAYATPTNIALVPGTTIPVCINSVNCHSTTISSPCTLMGPGAPYCVYYVNNETGGPASTYVRYPGFTVKLPAIAAVNPCDTYHLKLGVADASDHVLDSGVLIEGGSLSSTPPPSISAAGIPYRVRGCAPGQFVFTIPAPLDTNLTIYYDITGTAVNGYDYSLIADSVILPAFSTTTTLNIAPLLVPAVGPKVVTIDVLGKNLCTGADTVVAVASITILDSFSFRIITPDTAICQGQDVNIIAQGDTIFGGVMSYIWTPSATLSSNTSLTPTANPAVTTTYTLSDITPPVYGCPTEFRNITITVYDRPGLTVDSPEVKTCVGVPVQLHVYAVPGSVPNTYLWSPPTDLSNPAIWNPIVDPSVPGDVTYTVTVFPTAIPTGCSSTATVLVHTLGDFTLNTHDTAICINTSLQISVTGSSEFTWSWSPALFLDNPALMQPIVSPTVTVPLTTGITYVVTANYAHCPPMVDSFHLEVDYPVPTRIITDTLCLGQIKDVDFTVPGSAYFHYQWTPATFLSNDTIPNPVITPTVPGSYNWTLIIQPHAIGCADTGIVNMIVTPNSFTITPTDTSICSGNSVQVLGTSYYLFAYQWLPTAGIPISDIVNPMITPDTSATYVVTATFYKCPVMRDTLVLDVQPNPVAYISGDKFGDNSVCQFDTLHLHAIVNPAWYTHYSFLWTPASHLDSTNTQTVVFHGTTDTVVTVIVSTPKGCSFVDSAKITVYPGHFAVISPETKDFCPHDNFMPVLTGAASYHWYPSMYLSDFLSSQPVITPITSQTYSIVATSIYGCKDTLNFSAIVYPGGLINIGPDSVTLYPGQTFQLNPLTNCSNFEWFPPSGLSDWQIVNPVASPQISTKYILTGQTANGCKTVDSIDVIVDPQSLLALPNAFTPGSGPNNEFKILKLGIASLNYFRIFNRWGNLVFETTDIDKGWDGTFNGTPQAMGVFVYEVEAVTSTGILFQKHGNTTLIR
jgi:gliding motility-associated-like protein